MHSWHESGTTSRYLLPRAAAEPRPCTDALNPIEIKADRRIRMTTADILPAGLSPDLVVDFDIYDPSLTAPIDVIQERLAELSAKGPVVYSTAHGGHWVVTHYKEIQAVLTDPETFSSYPNNLVTSEQDIGMLLPVEADPPQHTGLRQALLPLFSPQRMKKLD